MPVVSVILVSPPNKEATFAFIFSYSKGYIVLRTYAAAHPKIRRIKNVFMFFPLCVVGAVEYDGVVFATIVGIGLGISGATGAATGVAIGGSTVWNVDPG